MQPIAPPVVTIAYWSPRGSGAHYNGGGKNLAVLAKTIRRLSGSRVRIILVHADPNHISIGAYDEEVRLPISYKQSVIGRIIFILQSLVWVLWNHRKWDVVYGLGTYLETLAPVALAGWLGRKAVVKPANLHSGLVAQGRLSRLLQLYRLRQRLLRSLSAVVAISAEIEQELQELGVSAAQIQRIPNGVDCLHFAPSVTGQVQRRADVVFVGEVVRRKRIDWVVSAMGSDHARHGGGRLVVVGPCPDTNYLSEIVSQGRALGVEIDFVGFVQDIRRELGTARVLALASLNEGMPNAVLEAQAMGIPVVVTPFSSAREVVLHGETGYVAQTLEEFTAYLTKVITASDSAWTIMSEAARANALARYSIDSVANAHIKFYKNILCIS